MTEPEAADIPSVSSPRQALAEAAAAWVFVKHVHHLSTAQGQLSELAYWPSRLLELGLDAIQAGLRHTAAHLVVDSGNQSWALLHKSSSAPMDASDLSDICVEIAGPQQPAAVALDKLGLVQEVTKSIGAVFCRLAPWNPDFAALLQTKAVHPQEIWTEDWAVPYMCTWMAEGTRNELLCPPWHVWGTPHLDYLSTKWGDSEPEIWLAQYLSCFLIPCHEVVHIAQTKHNLTDSDPTSYSAEHDASRLNMPLLLLVLRSDTMWEQQLDWFTPVLMVQAINKAIQARDGIKRLPKPDVVLSAYRNWADSFGLQSPTEIFKQNFAELSEAERQRRMVLVESYFKTIVTAEALGATGIQQEDPIEDHFESLLNVAFHPQRQGDVYAESNASLCQISQGHLALGEGAWAYVTNMRASELGNSYIIE